ncbi:hypothetical protein J27TS7_56790 [Paenibacillus dendritiformis]|uniref:hypothetical protein n=1 Tax=Paenibacillus dendritiformis TaxID=130049 RepID=UPI001B109F7D|nr:hypothetical protein [Paenibacillus dendritiformis]GIO76165.1 hypothetical protein J27TS7_56790 [Paenibacillus dendritiformis]
MDYIIIEPGRSIGTVKLGMTRDEVNWCIQKYIREYNDEEQRHFESYIIPEYDENEKLIALQVVRDLKNTQTLYVMKSMSLIQRQKI